ncbi:MAG: hypothetical protein EKK64_10285 [Neisseriaceae bacterium]|nr:MAG: hypothetical protein EKK64_10285 [Neisseriaceae bacterium]
MEFKLIFDPSKSIICVDSFVNYEMLNIKLYIKPEDAKISSDNSDFVQKNEEILFDKIMLELGDLVKKQIKHSHPYGRITKVQKKKTIFEKFKNIFKHKKETNVSRD